jgi:hypothetical protein
VAVGPLLDLLGSPDDHVRLRAVLSLGAIKDRKAKKPLEGLLDDGRREIREAAASALRGITTTAPLVVEQEPGTAMAVMESCEHCGASIDYGSKYCRYCGALLFDTGSLLS